MSTQTSDVLTFKLTKNHRLKPHNLDHLGIDGSQQDADVASKKLKNLAGSPKSVVLPRSKHRRAGPVHHNARLGRVRGPMIPMAHEGIAGKIKKPETMGLLPSNSMGFLK